MSKSKEKRIKRLKRKHIWPSIVGLVCMMFIFAVLLGLVLSVSMVDVVHRKLNMGMEHAQDIAALYIDYSEEESEGNLWIEQTVLNYMEFSAETEAVVLLDEQYETVWAGGTAFPNIKEMQTIEMFGKDANTEMQVIIEEDRYNIFEFENEMVEIDDDFISHIDFSEMLAEEELSNEEGFIGKIDFKIWYVIPVEGYNVCVLSIINIYGYDLMMLVVCAVMYVIFTGIFVIYYLISFFSLILGMHKTTKLIYTDMITGGHNWLYFIKKGNQLLKRNRSGKRHYAMVHLKLRKYRSFCTCFGVREAEELTEKFYGVLKKYMKKHETFALHENAEFGLLVTYADVDELVSRIKSWGKALDAVLPGIKLRFVSGVYLVEPKESDVDLLYNNALLAGEISGEDVETNIAFYNIEMNKQRLWERKVEDDMERALANKEFKVYLQPKISTGEEKLAGAEALVRWVHPTEGFIPPNKFIPIFEQNGFILKLDDYMLEEIARQQAEWIAQGRSIVPISVNVSRAHFTREDLAEHIVGIVDKYKVPHSVIELELTESAFFDDKQTLLNTVKSLREAGFPVSMDDFGAGYSSLNSLKEMHLDVLKIDADFFRGVEEEKRGMLIVSEVIDLAKKLDMKIVAEGIENKEQVDFLTELECDLIQGYFFAKPMPISEFEEKYN